MMHTNRKIILVDDQPSYRVVIRTILQSIGEVEVIAEASNGQEFLEIIDKKDADIVFMDIEMPVMDGIEATQKALAKKPNLVIIGLSMYETPQYIKELIDAGARGYLLKLSNNYRLLKTIIKYPKAEIFYSEKINTKNNPPNNTGKTVLIVDDFESNVFVVASTLEHANYRVFKAQSGENALKIINENQVDLVITDYNMP